MSTLSPVRYPSIPYQLIEMRRLLARRHPGLVARVDPHMHGGGVMGVAARLARPHLRGGGGGGVVARRIAHQATTAGCQQAAFLLERHQAGCHGQVLRVAQLFDLFLLLLLFLAFPVSDEPHDERGGGTTQH
jgi:hypothetical protein